MHNTDSNKPADYCVVLTTTATAEEAAQLARLLVEQQLAACVQRQAIQSTYWWDGAVTEDAETLLLIKTEQSRYSEVEAFIRAHHSYSVPEILCLPVSAGSAAYLNWIREVLGKPRG